VLQFSRFSPGCQGRMANGGLLQADWPRSISTSGICAAGCGPLSLRRSDYRRPVIVPTPSGSPRGHQSYFFDSSSCPCWRTQQRAPTLFEDLGADRQGRYRLTLLGRPAGARPCARSGEEAWVKLYRRDALQRLIPQDFSYLPERVPWFPWSSILPCGRAPGCLAEVLVVTVRSLGAVEGLQRNFWFRLLSCPEAPDLADDLAAMARKASRS